MDMPTKYEVDYEAVKRALGDRDPIADIASLNRSLHRRYEKEKALEAEVRALREALALQMFDLHEHSTRPCTTCAQSRKALGLDISTSEGMLGCGYSMVENRIAWRALAAWPPEPRS